MSNGSTSKTPPVIGLLGAGQLGRMLCESASPLAVPIALLDAAGAPAKQINSNPRNVDGSFKDPAKIRSLAAQCDVLTVEIEHIDTQVLEEIDAEGVAVEGGQVKKVAIHPSWRTLRLVQDKFEQKEYLRAQGLPVAEQMALGGGGGGGGGGSSDDDAGEAAMMASLAAASERFGFPWMLKARKDSYDGRGNLKISSEADWERAAREFGGLACYAERWVPFDKELAVMVVRTEDAEGRTRRVVPFPAVETVHEDSICSKVFMPPRDVPADVGRRAQDVASSVVAKLWGRGVFAVEMFLTKDGQVTVNEIAPRPHNSGHLTIEAVPYM
jgi:phosphoribosylaminoimidazole carboxylase